MRRKWFPGMQVGDMVILCVVPRCRWNDNYRFVARCSRCMTPKILYYHDLHRHEGREGCTTCNFLPSKRRIYTYGECRWCGATEKLRTCMTRCDSCERRRSRNGRCECGWPAYKSRPCPNCGREPVREKVRA